MKKEALRKFAYGFSILLGTIIGVGLFSLPYVTIKASLPVVIIYLVVLGSLAVIIHLFFGELSLSTPDFLRMPSFARIYLGKWGEGICFFSEVFGLLGTLLAYLILGGKFLSHLQIPLLYQHELFSVILYAVLVAILIYLGTRVIKKIEFLSLFAFFVIFIVIAISGRSFFHFSNLFYHTRRLDLFLPYGIILFSLWGADLIPEIEEILKPYKYLLKKLIITAVVSAIIFYFLFILAIVGISGRVTSEEGIIGLSNLFRGRTMGLLFLFAFLTTFTSYLTLGLTLKKIFWYDLKINKNLSWFIVAFVPLSLYLLGIQDFVRVISLVGGVAISLNGILITLMYQKLKKQRRVSIITFPLIVAFSVGIAYELIYFIK